MATRVHKLLEEVTDPSTRAAYSELCYRKAREAADKASAIAPFVVSDGEATTLERLGITTSPFATSSHTHAADKILENDMLQCISHYLPRDPVTLIQLKKSKLHLLRRPAKHDHFANFCYEPKDVLRYGITHPHSCPTVATEYAVLADTLHFMSPAQLVNLFTKNPRLDKLFATLVLPVEALHRLPSLFPEIYRLEYYDHSFAYMPGGHGGAAYVHSYGTLQWLSTAQIGTKRSHWLLGGAGDYLSLEKIETKAAHHLMLVQRRRPEVPWPLPTIWVFHASDYVRLPEVYYPPDANAKCAYEKSFIKRLQMYCLSVKAVSLRDIFAKMRQVIRTEDIARYSMADLIRVANYLILTTGMQQISDAECLLTSSLLGRISGRIRARIIKFLEPLRGKSSHAALLSVMDPIPIYFTTTPTRRGADGPDWFRASSEPLSFDDDTSSSNYEGPTLEDLELLADLQAADANSHADALPAQGPSPTSAVQGDYVADWAWDLIAPEGPEFANMQPGTENGPAPRRIKLALPEPDDLPDEGNRTAPSSPTRRALALHPGNCRTAAGLTTSEDPADRSHKTDVSQPDSNHAQTGERAAPNDTRGREHTGRAPQERNNNDDPTTAATNTTPATARPLRTSCASADPCTPNSVEPTTRLSDFDARTTEVLTLHGFTNLRQQLGASGPISPVFWNPKASKNLAYQSSSNTQLAVISLAERLKRHAYLYRVDRARATAYMSDVKNGLTGLVLPKLARDTLKAWVGLAESAERQVGLIVIHGAGGAGKSRALQDLLRNHAQLGEDTNVIVPTVNLVMDWKRKMTTMDPRRFITFEKACEREGRPITIFDDYGKLPAGYIDAYLAIKPTVELVVLTGDQRQSVFHTTNRDAQIASLSDNVAHYRRYCDYYLNATHRQPRRLANPIDVHAERELGGAVHKAGLLKKGSTVLAPAHRTQTTLTDLGHNAYTYSGCQGLTIPNVTIVLDGDTPLCSQEVLYTAFSRASETITLVNTHSDHPEFLAKLDATPYLKTLISGVREDEQAGRDHTPPEPEVPEPQVKTHFPVENDQVFLDPKVEQCLDKDDRELWSAGEKTDLMQTQDPVVQLFPHQQAKDEALFRLTIEKRIKTASPTENDKALARTCKVGDLLFEAYAQFMNVPSEPQPFCRDLWDQCKQKALRTYLSKPRSNLQQGAQRQDPDFPDNAIALFNKSQWVKKLEKVGFPFKAGQTISAFKQSTVLLTTTMALYLRAKREESQPDNVFIMCERTPEEFNTFVKTNWDFSTPSYTSDYEQYDQSQDGPFLNFELRKARHYGVPEEVLKFYRWLKLNAKTFVGNLAIMRLSGEGPTFDANTECNIAYDALRFQLTPDVHACYAGDDLARDQVCPERPSWRYNQHHFSLVAKPVSTHRPDFCGWRLTPHGILKSPIQLKQSLELAIRLGKFNEVRRSYALDYLFAYRLGDRLYEVLTEEEAAAHQLVTRALVKHGVVLPASGEHLPVFHVRSDAMIRNPHRQEMHEAASASTLITNF